jgi:penicillin-insensitive murein endopeptidase
MLARVFGLLALALLVAAGSARPQEPVPARDLFGAVETPAPMASRAVGFYSEGCLAGGIALPVDGPNWQAMRLERNRNWGHPILVSYIERLAADAARDDGWPGLLVGDMSQPRGGPMAGGHVSHQTGLDVDIWYLAMPDRRLTEIERSELSAISLVRPNTLEIDPSRWNEQIGTLLRRAASYPEVERIFVHPAVKAQLCEMAGGDRDWLSVIRPWYGHADHFHVRLACPAGAADCITQAPPPEGDGCGAELAWWLGPEPYRPPEQPQPPAPPKTMADLPAACGNVLTSGASAAPPLPTPRPQ